MSLLVCFVKAKILIIYSSPRSAGIGESHGVNEQLLNEQ
jgi:hypothetical protein